jgi:uncharacterized protein (UPF0332 family)
MPLYKDFEKIAQLLEIQSRELPQSQREVALRGAISTIYYGVFWELRIRLRNRGYKIREKQPHSLIFSILEKINPKASRLYLQLKKLRELADYQESGEVDLNLFKRAKNLAKLILEEV